MTTKPSLRFFARFSSCLALALMLSGGAGAAVPAPAFTVGEIKQISPADGYFHGWPTVTRLRNGTLVAAYSGGRDAHACPFGRVEVMYSLNEGRTWSWPQVVLDSPLDDRDAGLLETAKGTLLLTTFRSIGFTREGLKERYANDPARWDRAFQGYDPLELADVQGPMLLRSEDGGRSWQPPMRIPVNSPHGPIQLADGRLLYVGVEGVGKGRFYKPGERRTGVWESSDDGLTWTRLTGIPARAGDDPADYHELHGVQAADGSIVVQIRSHAGKPKNGDVADRHMLQTVSKDGGKTWSEPQAIGLHGYPPHLLRLRDDRLLVTFDRRRHPFGVAALISSDHGVTWSEPMMITKNEKKLDQGYPSTVQLKDGSFLTIWYEEALGEKRAVIKQAVWSLQ